MSVLFVVVYIVIFIIFTYEAGWIKWPFLGWAEHAAFGRKSIFWLIVFGVFLVGTPILILLEY